MGILLSTPEEPTRKARPGDEGRKTLPNGKPAPLVCSRCYKTLPCEHSEAEDVATLNQATSIANMASSSAPGTSPGGDADLIATSQLSFAVKDAENVKEVRRTLPTQQLISNMMTLCDSLLKSYDTTDAGKIATYSDEYEHLKKQADLLTKHHTSLQANKGKGSVGQEVLDLHFKQVDKFIERCDRFNQHLCGGDHALDVHLSTRHDGTDPSPSRNESGLSASSSSLQLVLPYKQ
jgi:hypothetical protein